MTSEVDICNLALSNIRGGSINSLNESSLQAQICKLKYPFVRDMLLTEISWGFNRRIIPLASLTTEVFNWAYSYQYPTNCLKINRLIGAQEELSNFDADVVSRMIDSQVLPLSTLRRRIPYEVFNFSDNKVIASNEADLRIDYAINVTDPNLFTNPFIMAFSHLLASEVAVPIVGAETGRQLRSDSLQMYTNFIATALANDMNEQQDEDQESEFVTVRR